MIRNANSVAFLPTAGILRIFESAYLTENKWSALADDFRTFLLGTENYEPAPSAV